MKSKTLFVAGLAVVGASLLSSGFSFADSIHTYDVEGARTYGEHVIKKVIETFPEEISNKYPASIHDSTGENPLEVTLNSIYGKTSSEDVIGIYYYDDDITLTAVPLDPSNADIVTTEEVAKIVNGMLFDAAETDTTEGNQSSIIVKRYLNNEGGDPSLLSSKAYKFFDEQHDAYSEYEADFESDEYEIEAVSKTFKITIPAHKKWGFYLTNNTDVPANTYYTDESFNEKPAELANRYYSRTADITVDGHTMTIFGLEDWKIDDRSGDDEECAVGGNPLINCMDANDIVFMYNDNYEEPEESEEPEEPENPDTGESMTSLVIFTALALAGIGIFSVRCMDRRN